MNILPRERNYRPVGFDTRIHAVKRRFESGWPIRKVLSYYHVKRPSLYRWLSRYDGIAVSASSVLRTIKRSGGFVPFKPAKKAHDKKYDTPSEPHEKWQVDVKYVPSGCRAPGLPGRFYHYTVLDECTRKRYLYFTNEHSMYETVSAIAMSILFFGCAPKEIQTDNGFDFTDKARRSYGNARPTYLSR